RVGEGWRGGEFVDGGFGGGVGLTRPDMFALKALGAVNPEKDVNCIMLMLVGAPSQLDTWDMKPDAPAEIRGPYKPIPTNVPGIRISEIFPRMAKLRTSMRWCDPSITTPPPSTIPPPR